MTDVIENANSNNGEQAHADLEGMDADALKGLVIKGRGEKTETDDKNRQLFERAKTAEGFTKQEDGSWIKVEKTPVKKETTKAKPKEEETQSDEFGMLEITFLNSESIKGEEETQFVKKQLEEAGLTKDQLPTLLQNKYFQSALETFRSEKSVADATSNVKSAGGNTNNAKSTPEYWEKAGKYPTAEEVPDRKVRAKIARSMMAKEKGQGDPYYNSKR